MSHFSQVKTQMKQRRILEKSLAALGLTISEGENVRGFMGQTEEAEFKVSVGHNYDIGFRKDASGNYEIVGDWEILPRLVGESREAFSARLKREYAKTSVLEIAKERGFEVQWEENPETSQIEMVVSQW